ncbi:hypothetical protein AQI88_27795 [Streptomyces cellostaticus]|uniref:Uncharacterized protein n=1 Tax=Streptomyces cellostaticus TaxID=67285 RepID=A0A117PV47_9ACTN|nr:hypothetical protein [Streptomyces cellostaticus]KUM93185.1 hypothetical protein AQI88_27795 [Streptomyces cellostaticus]GHI09569.1 hypothetical protein Scel_78900 [Streptomyces cellostaticus]
MSESSSRAPAAEPDFLDRLIARHAAAARPDTVRVRPRLPGPFERVEAVRARTADPDATDSVPWPSATPAPVPEREAPRPAATEVRRHTERERTVVRTQRDPAEPPARPAPPALPDAPLLRPAAPLAPGSRPVPRTGPRLSGRGGPESGADRIAAPVPIPPGTGAAPPASVSAAVRPSAADATAARAAIRQAAARRPARAPEQVVQVQIGRLEVTAGRTPPRNGAPQPARPAQRPGAAVSLADYLARGRE